jgi:peroxiredoxin Q/BCP
MLESPRAGDKAPAFLLPSTEGDVSLDGLLVGGRTVVLAFYHEDATPTCDAELVMLKDAYETLAQSGAIALAVSADSLESHRALAKRSGGFPFALATDVTLDAARAYGVVDEGNPRRSRRAVFVIGRDGKILFAIPHFQPSNLDQVESLLSALDVTPDE